MILMQLSYSAEKAFKAFLINHNASAELLHSHKLDELLTACIALDNRFKVLTDVSMKEYKDLSYYATGKKYQEENPHNKVFPIKRAVTIVQQVLTQCQNIMSSEKLPPESSSSSSEAPSNESIKQNLSIAPENKIQINKVRIFPIAIEPRTGELLVLLGQGQTGFYGDFDKTIKGETVEQAISKILNLQTNFQISADTSTPKRLAFTEDNGESIHFIKVRFVPQEELNQTAVSSFKKGYAWIPASYIMQAEKKLTYLGKYSIFKSTFVLLKKYLQSIKI
jgi:hypothetical protein